ncbi:MAG: magnesium transporter [Candidatus Omnitrophota bacterium]|nr:MAG: magnesium transporter [Candidatus Omnitrophota bacterium]
MRHLSIMLPEIRELLKLNKKEELNEALREMHPADIADALFDLHIKEQVALISRIDKEQMIKVFDELDEEEQFELLDKLEKELSAYLLNEMSPDERADLLSSLPDEVVNKFLNLMSENERKDVEKLLRYPANSAGSIMTTEYISLTPELMVSQAAELIRQAAPKKETIYYTYVTDHEHRLVGFVSLKDIFMAREDVPIKKLMHRRVFKAFAEHDQEEVAQTVRKYNLLALPVIDKDKKLVGIVTVDDIMDVLRQENTEDVYKMAAMLAPKEEYFNTGFFTLVRRRIVWLVILLIAVQFSGQILKNYGFALEAVVALAFFIPLLLNTAGNAGTQSSTTIIRGLATGEITINQVLKVVRREIGLGLVLGGALGVLGAGRALLLQGNPFVSLAVGLALAATIVMATLTGAFLPLLLKKLKIDPAVAAGPFISTVVDITALIVYFEIAKALLHL